MSLPPGFLDDLRARVSLADLAGRKVTWDRGKTNAARGDWWAPCPFHQERTASFHVRDREGFYYCFGCNAKGDAITFLRETENMGFMEAVELLAREAGLPMPARDPAAAARDVARAGLAEAMEACVRHYRLQLRTAAASAARDYLARRGLDEAALARFEIGFAPDARRGLADAMADRGPSEDELTRAGMLIRPDDGGRPFDRFRGRVMFPIRDARGRCIGFGGRAMSPEARAKYLNSPATELFDKGRSLYNIGPAREAAGKAGRLIVAEGYMDVIALVQAGFTEAVAPNGTAITEEQLDLMWRLADEPVIALDGDAAGLRAATRLADLALGRLAPGKSLRFCLMPQGEDPDDVIRAGGPEAMAALLERAEPLAEILWRKACEGRDLASPERRAAFDADLRALIRRVPDPGVRAHYGAEFRARRAALLREMAPAGDGRAQGPRGRGGFRGGFGGGRRGGFGASFAAPPTPELRRTALAAAPERAGAGLREAAILWGALHHPAAAERHEEALRDAVLADPWLAALRFHLLEALPDALAADAPAPALAAAVAARLGTDPLARLRDGRLALIRALGPDADAAEAALALGEVLDRHAAALSAQEECRAAEEDISVDTADEIAHRLAYVSREREETARRRPEADALSGDGEDRLSARLRAIIAAEPWVRGPKRKG